METVAQDTQVEEHVEDSAPETEGQVAPPAEDIPEPETATKNPAPVASVEAPAAPAPPAPATPDAKGNPKGTKHRYTSYGGKRGGTSHRGPNSISKKLKIKINPQGIFTVPSIRAASLTTKVGAVVSVVGGFVAVGASGRGLNSVVDAVAEYMGYGDHKYLEPVRDISRLGGELVLTGVYSAVVGSVADGPFAAYVRLGGGLLVAVDTGATLFKYARKAFSKAPAAPPSKDAETNAAIMGVFGLGSLAEAGIGTTETSPSTETTPTTPTVGYQGAPDHDPLVRELQKEKERTNELSALMRSPGGGRVLYNVPGPGRDGRPTLHK